LLKNELDTAVPTTFNERHPSVVMEPVDAVAMSVFELKFGNSASTSDPAEERSNSLDRPPLANGFTTGLMLPEAGLVGLLDVASDRSPLLIATLVAPSINPEL